MQRVAEVRGEGKAGSVGVLVDVVPAVGGVGFSSRQRVELAAALIPVTEPQRYKAPKVKAKTGYWLSIGPGVVGLRTGRQRPGERVHVELPGVAELLAAADSLAPVEPDRYLRADRLAELTLHDWIGDDDDQVDEHAGKVRGWSSRSRARMTRTLAAIDWTPLLELPGTRPGMVTLTYPGDWLLVAPSAEVVKRKHFEQLRVEFERRWKVPLVCAWKLEFQRRGAPHLHLFAAIPCGAGFQSWLSATWYRIVGSGDFRHLMAGTGVDFGRGAKCSDPRRLAVYFAKHGLFSAKDYQNDAPGEWECTGRIWGVRRLKRCEVEVQVDQRSLIEARRVLRHVERSRRRTVEHVRWHVDLETGELRKGRRQRRRMHGLRSLTGAISGGYLVVNDGPQLGVGIARYLASLRPWSSSA